MARHRFTIGQLITHRQFDYRGVIVEVDFAYDGLEDWYDLMSLPDSAKSKPWYHILVHGTDNYTYVAEHKLAPDLSGLPVDHPALNEYFESYQHGLYIPKATQKPS